MPEKAKLDALDWKILYELDCDASRPYSQIGKKLRVGRDVIAYRVKRLEGSGVIEKYISVIDFSKLGYIIGAIYIKFHHVTPSIRQEILEYYKSRKDIWWLFEMSPDFDFAFGWYGKDIVDMRAKQLELLSHYRKYFRDFKFRLFVNFYSFRRNYLLPQHGNAEAPVVMSAKPEKITDANDDRILRILSENARKTYVEIAHELRLSPAQVHYRIAALKKNKVLLWQRIRIDLQKIGFEYFKLDIYLDDYKEHGAIQKYVFSHPNVIYAFNVIGGADIEVDINIPNYEDFMKLQDLIKAKFSSSISHTEYYQFTKEYKQNYFPPL